MSSKQDKDINRNQQPSEQGHVTAVPIDEDTQYSSRYVQSARLTTEMIDDDTNSNTASQPPNKFFTRREFELGLLWFAIGFGCCWGLLLWFLSSGHW